MLRSRNNNSTNTLDVSHRIDRIVSSVIARWNSGDHVDELPIETENPELMPQLRESLQTARAIFLAAQEARRRSGESVDAGAPDELLEDEIEYLKGKFAGFDIIHRIDHGGQGVVYKAVQKSTGRTVAIKLLLSGAFSSQRQRDRFAREVELVSRLQHPAIVRIYESGVVAGRPFFAMEFVEGLSIDDYLLLNSPPVRDCVRLFTKICRAIHYAHLRGIIHRDLKPSNILVDNEGEPHILDFGLAKRTEDDESQEAAYSISQTGQVVGTLPYLSPEQASGSSDDVDVRSDIYSLGIIFYRLLSGAFPYPIPLDPTITRENIMSAEPVSLRQARRRDADSSADLHEAIDVDLDVIILKTLSKEKADRYQSAEAFAADLDRYLAGEPVQARAAGRLYLFLKFLRRYRLQASVAAAFLIVIIAAGGFSFVQWLHARAQRDNARAVAALAHSAFSDQLGEIENSIANLAGGAEVRNRLLQNAARKLETLRGLVENDAAMEGLLIQLREKQGDIAAIQGRLTQAEGHYLASLSLADRPAASTPEAGSPPLDSIGRARIHRKLAGLHTAKESEYWERSIKLAESALTENPRSNEARFELCSAHVGYGTSLRIGGHVAQAALESDKGLEIANAMIDQKANDIRWGEVAAAVFNLNGQVQRSLGNGDGATIGMLKSLETRRHLRATFPANVTLQFELMISCNEMGLHQKDKGDLNESAKLHKEALEIGSYLLQADSSMTSWKKEVFRAHEALAYLTIKKQEPLTSDAHCSAMARLSEELIGLEPNNLEFLQLRAATFVCRGYLCKANNQWDEMNDCFGQAVAIWEEIATLRPMDPNNRAELARHYEELANSYRVLGLRELALHYYLKARVIFEELHQAKPGLPRRRMDLFLSHTRLSIYELDRKETEGDLRAAQLIAGLEDELEQLCSEGVFAGREGEYRRYKKDLDANKNLAADRVRLDSTKTPPL